MTADRDELAELIRSDLLARSHEDDWGVPCVYPEVVSDELADAILAAGTWIPTYRDQEASDAKPARP